MIFEADDPENIMEGVYVLDGISTTNTSSTNTSVVPIQSPTTGTPNSANEITPPGVVGSAGRKVSRPVQKKVQRKLFKESGQQYTTISGKVIPAKRHVKPGCDTKCKRKCQESFSEEDRKKINFEYWNLSHSQKKDFVLRCVNRDDKRRTTVGESSRRNFTRCYSLPKSTDYIQVCRNFFLSTVNCGTKFLRYTEEHCTALRLPKTDERGTKNYSSKKTSPMNVKNVKRFIERLPAVNSHYCRGSTVKKYLPEEFENVASVYRNLYVQYCRDNNYQVVSLYVFKSIWRRFYNIGIHHPKKDKCTTCLLYNQLSSPNPEETHKYEEHIAENEARKKLYIIDQENVSKPGNESGASVTCSFDLQKVLHTPSGRSMLFSYSRKYAVYNLTFYESHTRNAYCYLWGEKNGNRGCNEVCTIMEMYLKQLDGKKVTEINLYCDNCAGQQKNKAMITLLMNFLQNSTHVKKITLNFLVSGHSFMTVDSIHGTIERSSKNKTVYAPSEWSTIIANARIHPFPYTIIQMKYNDFKDWKTFSDTQFNFRLDDGSSFKVSEVQRCVFDKIAVQHKSEFGVFFSARNENVTIVKCKQKRNSRQNNEPSQAYFSEIPIAALKYRDLINLCVQGAIPKHHHAEYFNLPSSESATDRLAEPDEEEDQPAAADEATEKTPTTIKKRKKSAKDRLVKPDDEEDQPAAADKATKETPKTIKKRKK